MNSDPATSTDAAWIVGLLQAGASMKGEFENRLRQVIDEVQSSPTPIILFIDEAHTLIGAGGAVGQNDAANLLKPALARGELRMIAATIRARQASTTASAATVASQTPVWPTMSGFAKLATMKSYMSLAMAVVNASVTPAALISG